MSAAIQVNHFCVRPFPLNLLVAQGEMSAMFLRHEGFLGAVGAFLKVNPFTPPEPQPGTDRLPRKVQINRQTHWQAKTGCYAGYDLRASGRQGQAAWDKRYGSSAMQEGWVKWFSQPHSPCSWLQVQGR